MRCEIQFLNLTGLVLNFFKKLFILNIFRYKKTNANNDLCMMQIYIYDTSYLTIIEREIMNLT